MPDKKAYQKTALIGGGASALDGIDGAGLLDGDFAFVTVSGIHYLYILDDDSAAAESSPDIISPDTNAGNKRWILQRPKINVGSDADGDMYYPASSLLARLAKGAANLKLFMNAGATAPEWAAGVKVGSFTRAMDAESGDVAYTGAGFLPGLLLFSGAVNAGAIISYFGGACGAAMGYTAGWPPGNFVASSTACIVLAESNTKIQVATIKTYDADGFTLTWTRTGATAAGTAAIVYAAFR